MKKKSNTRVFSILVALAAFVAIMCMFADIFDEEIGSAEGNIFVAMFGMHSTNHYVVWPIVIGFVLLIALVLVGFAGFILADAGKKFIPFIEIVLGIGVGILFFFVVDFYFAANSASVDTANISKAYPGIGLGAGSICVIVFSFLAAALGLLNVLTDKKSEN